jgi:hypothetical protein
MTRVAPHRVIQWATGSVGRAASVATAMQAVNSIPALCEAEPGWRSSLELGLVRTGIGFRNAT